MNFNFSAFVVVDFYNYFSIFSRYVFYFIIVSNIQYCIGDLLIILIIN